MSSQHYSDDDKKYISGKLEPYKLMAVSLRNLIMIGRGQGPNSMFIFRQILNILVKNDMIDVDYGTIRSLDDFLVQFARRDVTGNLLLDEGKEKQLQKMAEERDYRGIERIIDSMGARHIFSRSEDTEDSETTKRDLITKLAYSGLPVFSALSLFDVLMILKDVQVDGYSHRSKITEEYIHNSIAVTMYMHPMGGASTCHPSNDDSEELDLSHSFQWLFKLTGALGLWQNAYDNGVECTEHISRATLQNWLQVFLNQYKTPLSDGVFDALINTYVILGDGKLGDCSAAKDLNAADTAKKVGCKRKAESMPVAKVTKK